MVRKSTPANALISPVCNAGVRISRADRLKSTGTYVAERGTHDDGLVSVLLVVVVDGADGLDARVLLVLVSGSGLVLLVPVQNTTNEGRDESDTSLGASHSLAETEQESKVAVDLIVALEFTSGLDTLPGRSDFDENAILGDADGLVELDQVPGLYRGTSRVKKCAGAGDRGNVRTLALVASLSNESLASTSVETRPGTMAKISFPNSTSY